jgi:hypothetical protein
MKKKIIGTLVAKGKPICVSADGQYDSPGHNAAYLFHRWEKKFYVRLWATFSAFGSEDFVIVFFFFFPI